MQVVEKVVALFRTTKPECEENAKEETYRFIFDDFFGNQTNYYKFVKVVPNILINYLINTLDSKKLEDAAIGGTNGSELNKIKRRSKVYWLPKTNEFLEIYKLFFELIHKSNNEFFHFKLTEITEHIQYTVYNSDDLGYYDWHIDMGPSKANRKLSLVCNLTDPNEYEGGELQLNTGEVLVPERDKGTVIIFPSYILHRVTPVTRGIRRTLVLWIEGPSFS
jgi:PKHD-type hydroxylase